MSLESDDGCIGGTWYEWVMEDHHRTYGFGQPLASASQGDPNDHWQDIREGGEVGEVFDGGTCVDDLGQVIVVNPFCCLMHLQAWKNLSRIKSNSRRRQDMVSDIDKRVHFFSFYLLLNSNNQKMVIGFISG